jgi:hypothetical protein
LILPISKWILPVPPEGIFLVPARKIPKTPWNEGMIAPAIMDIVDSLRGAPPFEIPQGRF